MSDSNIQKSQLPQEPEKNRETPELRFPPDSIKETIPDRLEDFSQRYPNRIAVKSKNTTVRWDQLNQTANRVARSILTTSKTSERPIALLLDSEPLIVASLGVLKAEGVCVPLSLDDPISRHAYILNETEPILIVTNHRHLSSAMAVAQNRYPVLDIDSIDPQLSGENLDRQIDPTSICYITYTSGSTGEPKGVLNTHQKVIQGFNYGDHFKIGPEDHFTDLGSGLRNPFLALLNGASLFPWRVKEQGLAALPDWLTQEEISVVRCGPRVFRHFVSDLSRHKEFPKLRGIILAGEPVLKSDVELFRRNFSETCVLVNMLGAHEVGPFRIFIVTKNSEFVGERVPSGYEIPGKKVVIVDEERRLKQTGEIGEIAVLCRYLSSGYWRKPALTEAKFVSDPANPARKMYLTGDLGRLLPDGCLQHLGRKDFQTKIRGFTVDTTEVEKALTSHEGIKEATVTTRTRPDMSGDSRLIAYFVPTGQGAPNVTNLRNHLKKLLPDYMIPAVFVKLSKLPTSDIGTGKLDRRALPEPDSGRPDLENAYVSPATAVEQVLAQIWAEVLSLNEVGTQDNFLELGGDSLSAIRIINRVIQSFQLELPITALLDCPTISGMASLIMQNQDKEIRPENLNRMLAKLEAMTEEEALKTLAEESFGSEKVSGHE